MKDVTDSGARSSLCRSQEPSNGEGVGLCTFSGFIGCTWVSLSVVGFPLFVSGLFFDESFFTGKVVKKEVLGNDIDIFNGFMKVNEPRWRVVVVNVNHEAGLRVHPEIGEPVGGVAKVDGFRSSDLGVHDEVVSVPGVTTGAFTIVSLRGRM